MRDYAGISVSDLRRHRAEAEQTIRDCVRAVVQNLQQQTNVRVGDVRVHISRTVDGKSHVVGVEIGMEV